MSDVKSEVLRIGLYALTNIKKKSTYWDCFMSCDLFSTSVYASLSPGIESNGFGGNWPTVALEKCAFPCNLCHNAFEIDLRSISSIIISKPSFPPTKIKGMWHVSTTKKEIWTMYASQKGLPSAVRASPILSSTYGSSAFPNMKIETIARVK